MRMQRGRALRFLFLLMTLWIGARIYLLWGPGDAPVAATELLEVTATPKPKAYRAVPAMAIITVPWWPGPPAADRLNPKPAPAALFRAFSPRGADRMPLLSGTAASPGERPALPSGPSKVAPPPLPVITGQAPTTDDWSVYSYAFLRFARGPADLAQTRYGGSQIGAIAYRRLAQTSAGRIDALARLNYAPDDPRSLEAGAGLRWSPRQNLSVAAEYRRRADGTGTAIAYAAGGTQAKLPAGFTLAAYGQAGLYRQDGTRAEASTRVFADAQITATRPLAEIGGLALEAGAGSWAGGTDKTRRLDIGPRLSASAPLGDTRITLAADYRLRIAGNAEPANGPTLTLSAGF